jgi:hypothetical protein
MANRRRQVVSLTLPEDVIADLRALAKREYRAFSREAEVAIVRHLAEARNGAAS